MMNPDIIFFICATAYSIVQGEMYLYLFFCGNFIVNFGYIVYKKRFPPNHYDAYGYFIPLLMGFFFVNLIGVTILRLKVPPEHPETYWLIASTCIVNLVGKVKLALRFLE